VTTSWATPSLCEGPRCGKVCVVSGLDIERGTPSPGVVELRVKGDVDLGSGKLLERELATVVAAGNRVLVNLGECTFMDSSGLSALIRTARSVPEPGHFAVFCLPEGTVRQVFSLTRAHTLLDVHADRDEALAALAG
jgi:anti-anti-sigma factor